MMPRLTRTLGGALLLVAAIKLVVTLLAPALDPLLRACVVLFALCLMFGLAFGRRKEW